MSEPVCDGCNVHPPWEHRCHGSPIMVRGERVNARCGCGECNVSEETLALLREIDAARGRAMEWQLLHRTASRERDEARAEVERLREALRFYANPEIYHGCYFGFDSPTGGFDEDFSEDHGHPFYERPMPGARARKALEVDGGDLCDLCGVDLGTAEMTMGCICDTDLEIGEG